MFDCEKCGACCKNVGHVVQLVSINGQCVHLLPDNSCAIYETRPWVCRVDDIYDNNFKADMTKEEFYAWTRWGCEQLREELSGNKKEAVQQVQQDE